MGENKEEDGSSIDSNKFGGFSTMEEFSKVNKIFHAVFFCL